MFPNAKLAPEKKKEKKKKVMITVWAAAGLIHYSFLNTGETIISEKYAQQINEMHHKLQHLQLALVDRKGPILQQDNAWPHMAQSMLQNLNELGYEIPSIPVGSVKVVAFSGFIDSKINERTKLFKDYIKTVI